MTADSDYVLHDLPPRLHPLLRPGAVTLPPDVRSRWDVILAALRERSGGPGAYLWGKVGTGKTLSACVLVTEARRAQAAEVDPRVRPWGARFVPDHEIIRRARGAMESGGASFSSWVSSVLRSRGLVVLDDIASGGPAPYTPWEAKAIGDFAAALHAEGVPFVATSNVDLDGVARILGDRTASRLAELGAVLELVGEDRRFLAAALGTSAK